MPPCLDAFAITNSRTKQVLDRFVERFVSPDFSTGRQGEQVNALPLGSEQHPEQLDDYDWFPAESVEQVISLGLAQPWRGFAAHFHPADDRFCDAIIAFTTDGQLVLGLGIDDANESDDNVQFAKSTALRLAGECSAHTAIVGEELPPPLLAGEVPSAKSPSVMFVWQRPEL